MILNLAFASTHLFPEVSREELVFIRYYRKYFFEYWNNTYHICFVYIKSKFRGIEWPAHHEIVTIKKCSLSLKSVIFH